MRLALVFEEPNPDVLKRKISSSQYAKWAAFMRVERYGPFGMDERFARLMSVIANVMSDDKFDPEDFMPEQGQSEAKDPEELAEMVKNQFG